MTIMAKKDALSISKQVLSHCGADSDHGDTFAAVVPTDVAKSLWTAHKSHSGSGNYPVFCKFQPHDEQGCELEALFSSLYQLDLGVGAAQTVQMQDEDGQPCGMVSFAFSHFLEYRQLVEASAAAKRQAFLTELAKDCGSEVSIQTSQQLQQIVLDYDHTPSCLGEQRAKPQAFEVKKGLAEVLMSAWLYGEDDLHRCNFGLSLDVSDEDKAALARGDLLLDEDFIRQRLRWVRLDFGLSFSAITSARPFRGEREKYSCLTLADYQQLPCLQDSQPFYWPTWLSALNNTFNFRGKGKGNAYDDSDKALFETLANDSDFIEEKYRFTLTQFLVSIENKMALVKAGITHQSTAERLSEHIKHRIASFRHLALADPGFRRWVKNLDEITLAQHIKKLQWQSERNSGGGELLSETMLRANFSQLEYFVEELNAVEVKAATLCDHEKKQAFHAKVDEDVKQTLALSSLDKGYLGQISKTSITILKAATEFGVIEQGLALIQSLQVKLSVMEQFDKIHALLPSSAACTKPFFQLRESLLLPFMLKLHVESDDVIHNHHLALSLRNCHDWLSKIQALSAENYLALVDSLFHQANQDPSLSISQRFFELEAGLMRAYFSTKLRLANKKLARRVPSELTRLHRGIINSDGEFGQLTKRLLDKLTTHIDTKNNKYSVYDLLNQPYVHSLNRILIMLEKFSSTPANDLNAMSANYWLRNKLTQQLKQDTLDSDSFCIIEMTLSQFNLKLAIIKAKHTMQQATARYAGVIDSAQALCDAMGKPNLYTPLELTMVSKAGHLVANTLADPSIQNAQRCLRFAKTISHHHALRTRTKIAAALCVLGISIVLMGLLALDVFSFGVVAPLTGPLHIYFIGLLGVSVATLAMGTYACRRFYRDKTKVQRKLTLFGQKVDEFQQGEGPEQSVLHAERKVDDDHQHPADLPLDGEVCVPDI